MREEKSLSQRAFSIYTDIRKLQDKAKTSYTLSTRRLRFGYEQQFSRSTPRAYAYDTKAVILAGNNAEGNFHIQYYEGKFNAYQRTYIIETNDETIVDIRYLYYALKICLLHFKQISQGTATKFLTAKILNAFELPIPRIEEQQKIAFLLAEIDEKIKTNEIINNNLAA